MARKDKKKEKEMGNDLDWVADHPVSSVKWVDAELIHANDYNPNTVAPPEIRLLELSIRADGFTQPIVTFFNDGQYEVVDGFHRFTIGKKLKMSHLPVVVINSSRQGRKDRIASTIRHNRARGKHGIEEMSKIVAELSKRNWSDARISKELGMDSDEVLRLKQVTGLAEIFRNEEFSEAWEIRDEN